MSMVRIVVDTNVFVSALLSPDGAARAVLRSVLSGRARPIFGNALIAEYESLLGRADLWRDCPLDAAEREELFDAIVACGEWVRIHFLWRPNLGDEGDNHVLELAVAGGAAAIVTGNLRDFQQAELLFPAVRIITPSAYLTWRHHP